MPRLGGLTRGRRVNASSPTPSADYFACTRRNFSNNDSFFIFGDLAFERNCLRAASTGLNRADGAAFAVARVPLAPTAGPDRSSE